MAAAKFPIPRLLVSVSLVNMDYLVQGLGRSSVGCIKNEAMNRLRRDKICGHGAEMLRTLKGRRENHKEKIADATVTKATGFMIIPFMVIV